MIFNPTPIDGSHRRFPESRRKACEPDGTDAGFRVERRLAAGRSVPVAGGGVVASSPTSRCNSGQLARYAAIIASCAMRPRSSPRMSSGPTLVWSNQRVRVARHSRPLPHVRGKQLRELARVAPAALALIEHQRHDRAQVLLVRMPPTIPFPDPDAVLQQPQPQPGVRRRPVLQQHVQPRRCAAALASPAGVPATGRPPRPSVPHAETVRPDEAMALGEVALDRVPAVLYSRHIVKRGCL